MALTIEEDWTAAKTCLKEISSLEDLGQENLMYQVIYFRHKLVISRSDELRSLVV